jgi:uncharacterized protein (TIGR02996 family)
MSERESFLKAITDFENDLTQDGPKLVWADRLDEDGDPLGAAIRIIVEAKKWPARYDARESDSFSAYPGTTEHWTWTSEEHTRIGDAVVGEGTFHANPSDFHVLKKSVFDLLKYGKPPRFEHIRRWHGNPRWRDYDDIDEAILDGAAALEVVRKAKEEKERVDRLPTISGFNYEDWS